MDCSDSGEALIKKEIIYNGSKYVPLVDGTKVRIFTTCSTYAILCKQICMEINFFLGKISLSNKNML